MPVVDYYKQFGKVRHIKALGSIQEVYAQSKEAAMPECMFMLGPKACGKSTIAEKMVSRVNMHHIDFTEFVHQNGLRDQGDEMMTQ